MDSFGGHDQRCPHAFSLGRHDHVQNTALWPKLKDAGKDPVLSTVHELRASSTDRSQRKGDITATGLHEDGLPTILDVGITYPLVDTNITNKSTVERGFAANRYASRKNDNANAIIDNGNLPYHFSAITFGTFGAFGNGTWSLINTACDEATHPNALDDYDPWSLPGPKRDFILSLGFALQRANSNMLRRADERRRQAIASNKYSSRTRARDLGV